MSNIHHLKQPPTTAWPGQPALDAPRQTVFEIGNRVIVPGTQGSTDAALRAGGPGKVVDVRARTGVVSQLVYVTVDGSTEGPLLYDPRELRREPTV